MNRVHDAILYYVMFLKTCIGLHHLSNKIDQIPIYLEE